MDVENLNTDPQEDEKIEDVGTDNTDTKDIPDSESEETTESTEDTSNDESDDSSKDDSVPLAKYMDTKNKYKAAKRKLAELEDNQVSEETRNKVQALKEKWLEKGYSEEAASDMAEMMSTMYEEVGKTKQSKQDAIFEEEIEDLQKTEMYKDIKVYSTEIKKKINLAKKIGTELSIEEAYLMVVGVKNKIKELKIDEEVKATTKTTGSSKGADVANSSGIGPSSNKLSPEDMKALVGLQKMQPDAKWTVKKYIEVMKG